MTRQEADEVWQIFKDAEKRGDTFMMNAIKNWHPDLFLQIGKWYESTSGMPESKFKHKEVVFCFNGSFDLKQHGRNRDGEWNNFIAANKDNFYRKLDGQEVCRLLGLEAKKLGYFKHFSKDCYVEFDDEKNTLTICDDLGPANVIFDNGKWVCNPYEIKVNHSSAWGDLLLQAITNSEAKDIVAISKRYAQVAGTTSDSITHNFKIDIKKMNDHQEKMMKEFFDILQKPVVVRTPRLKAPKKWYINKDDSAILFFVDENHAFGFVLENFKWKWMNKTMVCNINCENCNWQLADKKMVRNLIKVEAAKKFKIGDVLNCAYNGDEIKIMDSGKFSDSLFKFDLWANMNSLDGISICLFDGETGIWAQPNKQKKQKPINRWYKSESGSLRFFVSETKTFGLTPDGYWTDVMSGWNLMDSFWTEVDDVEVKHALLKFALNKYKHGQKITSARNKKTTGIFASPYFVQISATNFSIMSNASQPSKRVIIFNGATGEWAK